jgi:hypothetical protein
MCPGGGGAAKCSLCPGCPMGKGRPCVHHRTECEDRTFVRFSTEADKSEVTIKLVYKRTYENGSYATWHCVNGYAIPDFIFKCSVILGPSDTSSYPVVTRTKRRGAKSSGTGTEWRGVKSSGTGTEWRGVGSHKNGLVNRSAVTNSKLENSLVSYPQQNCSTSIVIYEKVWLMCCMEATTKICTGAVIWMILTLCRPTIYIYIYVCVCVCVCVCLVPHH